MNKVILRNGVVFMAEESLLLIDGMSLLFRGYYATAYRGYIRRTSDGTPTNAIYSFVKYMWDAIETFSPSHVACCWDMGGHTFRNEMFPDYKGNRPAPPDDLVPQFELVKDVVESFGIPNIGLVNYEADDVIGTLAKKHSCDMTVSILTSDHDSLQLIDDRTQVIIMKKGMSNYLVYNKDLLMNEKGLTPEQIIDLKGLMGDSSDHYPGVAGIGEKTAMKLLKSYSSIKGILENIADLPKGVRNKIENQLDMLHLSRKLATIKCDVPVTLSIHKAKLLIEYDLLEKHFLNLELHSLLPMIQKKVQVQEKLNG